MTDLALSGLATPLLGAYSNPPRSPRNEQAQANASDKREAPREVERVVTGELLPASDSTYSHLNKSPNRFSDSNNFASNTGAQTRRFDLQSAIQMFRDNEAIIVDQNRAVQVSGIIDEYV